MHETLSGKALVTLQTAKDFIAPGGMTALDDAAIVRVIDRVSHAVERHCGRPFRARTNVDQRFRGPWTCELFLKHTPIDFSAPLTVKVDEVTQTVWRTEGDGDPTLYDVILASSTDERLFTPDHLYRSCGWSRVNSGPNVRLTYTGGFFLPTESVINNVPDDLQEATLEIIRKLFVDMSKGTQDLTAVSLPNGSFTVFDQAFPRRSLQLLERYRRVAVG